MQGRPTFVRRRGRAQRARCAGQARVPLAAIVEVIGCPYSLDQMETALAALQQQSPGT